jgi:pimeloyl-ACP methyl ester carboxylesterase
VDGCQIRYCKTGDPRHDRLILLHGAMAHSGWWRPAAAYLAPFRHLVRAVVCVDSAVIPHPPTSAGSAEVKYYQSLADGMRNFRLRPRGTCADPAVLADIARHGLRETSRGWRWKFDPAVSHRISRDVLNSSIADIRCPIVFVYGASSEVAGPATVSRLAELNGRAIPSVAVADAFHHVPVDAPARTAAAIAILLATARVAP